MSDSHVVASAGIHRAIIVDDGYDEVPVVKELIEEEGWESFFDDAQGSNAGRVQELFPEYDPADREDLKSNQAFIGALWEGRNEIGDLLGELFEDYERKAREDRRFLRAAEGALDTLGISFKTCGRDFEDAALEADLIVIDLFLGCQQGPEDRELTVERLRTAIDRRERPLPSIILMSRVPGIAELAKDFRRDVQLHASAFRYVLKSDLCKPGCVEGLILTLAAHRADSHALASFLEVWQEKAVDAVQRATGNLRRIDIDDLQHMRHMLLRFEGLNTSAYMLDVFDRVLQYEIEEHGEVVEAANSLDVIADDPAPLLISNDRDTYSVLEKVLFVNPNRRAHMTGAVWPIRFGDILGPKPGSPIKPRGFFSGRENLVFFVASPDCDLIREGGLTTALLISGTLEEINISKAVLGVSGSTTPVLVVDDGKRWQVNWDVGDLRTISLKRANRLLKTDGDAVIVGRLRSVSALELRQQFLSNAGRVGQIAPLPRSFRFTAEIHYPSANGGALKLALPEGVEIKGNALVTRNGKFANLIFDSSCENDLTTALLDLDIDKVNSRSRNLVTKLMEVNRTRKLFRSGLQWVGVPLPRMGSAEVLKDGEPLPEKDDKKPKVERVGRIVTGADFADRLGSELPKTGLLFYIMAEDADA